jgi:adenine-specific DNA-methyltransferase
LKRTGQDAARSKRPKGWFPVFITPSNDVYVTDDDQPLDENDTTIWPINDEGDEMSWSWGKPKITDEPHNLVVVDGRSGKNIYKKQRPKLGDLPTKKPKSIFYKPDYSSSTATTELKNLIGQKVFEGPKPVPLLADFVKIGAPDGGLVLDFFAGSGTSAQAVMRSCVADGIKRNFICVQLPEKTQPDSDAYAAGYSTISELSRDRIRKSITSLRLDGVIGFRSFNLASSAFSQWEVASDVSEGDLLSYLENHSKNIGSASEDDILYEILLKDGFKLTTKVERIAVGTSASYSVADGALLICLERNLTKEVIDALADLAAERDAARVVCLDAGFQGNDQLKTNAVQTFKSRLGHGEDTSIFRTV